MDFKIVFDNDTELLEKDASLSCGYFEVIVKGLKISFFSEGSCMIFLTLDTLIYFFDSDKKSFRWVGEDNGKFFTITKKKGLLEIKDKEIAVLLDYKNFEAAARAAAIQLLTDAQNANSSITTEGAFMDLRMAVYPNSASS